MATATDDAMDHAGVHYYIDTGALENLSRLLAAAEARCAELEAQKNAALQRAWSAEASLSVRVGMRREFEEILGVSDTMEPGAFEAGMERLRALQAAESRAARYEAAIQRWREGRAHIGTPMTYVDQRLIDTARTIIGDARAAKVAYDRK
jgi:hypothetical protein